MSWRDNLPLTLGRAHIVGVLHRYRHGHFSLSFRLGLWFDTVAALQKEFIVVLLNKLLGHFVGIRIIISVDLLDGHQIILDIFEILTLKLFSFLE